MGKRGRHRRRERESYRWSRLQEHREGGIEGEKGRYRGRESIEV